MINDPLDDDVIADDAPIDDDGDEVATPDTPDTSTRRHVFRVGRDLDNRLDKYLVDRVGHLSRAEVQRLIKEKAVTVNGKSVKASHKPREGEEVIVSAPPPRRETIEPEPIPLDVLYEDDHLLAINKQSNLIVHPARGVWNGTLVNGLIHYAKSWSTVRGPHRPGILHRLDRNTTGVMLVAKSDEAHWRLGRQFENRTIKKTYLAVAHGIPELQADMIDLPIGPDAYVRERQAVRKIEKGGKTATTQYQVEETFRDPPESMGLKLVRGDNPNDLRHKEPYAGFSLIRLKPRTGRTHQLRVHLSFKGYPIVGDTMYGGRVIEFHDAGETKHFARQALHAAEITFTHPRTLQPTTIAAPLPPDIEDLLSRLRGTNEDSTEQSSAQSV